MAGLPLLTEREEFLRDHPPAGGIGLVPLGGGRAARVDAADYDRATTRRWWFNGGSVCTMNRGRTVTLPHFLIGLRHGQRVRYRDGDPLNCRRSNLEAGSATRIQAYRGPQRRPGKSSRYKGVSFNKRERKYEAHLYHKGKSHRLGKFKDEVSAALARDEKARELYGPGAYLNFPDPPPRPSESSNLPD